MSAEEQAAAILQCRMSWPAAERCATQLAAAGLPAITRARAVEVLTQRMPHERAAACAEDLKTAGLTEERLPVGARVRHHGQQYQSARANGTGNVAAVEGPMHDGSWEYLIYHDANGFTSGPSWWSSLRTIPVSEQG